MQHFHSIAPNCKRRRAMEEIRELTVEELEERTSPGIVIVG
jgi:hypothetical protein